MNVDETRYRSAFLKTISLSALAVCAFSAPAVAQEAEEADEEARQETVIVTGVREATSKQDATFTINTFDQDQIRELAPISTADLLQNVPGIFAEGSTAGEASNNITVRGLPVTGGYRYAPQLIDGLPWFEESEVQFMNNDAAARADIMTRQVEVVKGGTGGILYSNGLGATVNHITRTGGQEFEGGYKLELADYGFVRNDLFVSGPINENLTYAIGGYYRTSDGLRDVGFTADQGGQIRANLLYTSDDDTLEVFGQYHKIQDTTAFYQNVPFQVPAFSERGTAENPIEIQPDEVFELGIDFQDGSVLSPFNRLFTQLGEYGEREIDLADGLTADFDMFTFKVSKEFQNGWELSSGLRVTNGTNDFNAMFTGNDTTSAERFLNARYQNDVVGPAFGQALRGECDAAKLAGFFDTSMCEMGGFVGVSRQDFIDNFGIAQSVGAFALDDGSRIGDDELLNFLLPFITQSEAESASFDIQATKSFEFFGDHDFTIGAYASDYSVDQNFQSSLLVSTMEENSRLAELRALDADGNVVGPSLTLNGAILPGFFGYTSNISAQGQAIYALDHWELMDNRLKLDLGVRWQDQESSVIRFDRNIIAGSNLTPASVVPGSDGDTTADDEVFLPSNRRASNNEFDGFGWSIGANYSVAENFAVYGLVSDSFRLPSLEDLNEFRVDDSRDEEQVESIMQYEGGIRYYADTWDTQIAVFYNEFSPRQESVTFRDFTDPTCVVNDGVPDINTCPEVRESFERGVENLGIEIEAAWYPDFVEGLEFRGNVVFQEPEIVGANFRTVREIRENDVVVGFEFENIGEDGRRPRRLSEVMLNVEGTWDTKPLTGYPFKPYARYSYFGDRFSESRDVDVTLYPEYFHIDGGFIWDFNEDLAFQFHVSNITNELSFTEGDPLFADLKGPNGATNRGVARPLFGRTVRAILNYRF
ncbi:MAG: TonB-dependent receptor [Pseudomonadota bacterium]